MTHYSGDSNYPLDSDKCFQFCVEIPEVKKLTMTKTFIKPAGIVFFSVCYYHQIRTWIKLKKNFFDLIVFYILLYICYFTSFKKKKKKGNIFRNPQC